MLTHARPICRSRIRSVCRILSSLVKSWLAQNQEARWARRSGGEKNAAYIIPRKSKQTFASSKQPQGIAHGPGTFSETRFWISFAQKATPDLIPRPLVLYIMVGAPPLRTLPLPNVCLTESSTLLFSSGMPQLPRTASSKILATSDSKETHSSQKYYSHRLQNARSQYLLTKHSLTILTGIHKLQRGVRPLR